MLVENIIHKIRRRENRFYAVLYSGITGFLRLHIPVAGPIKLLYRAMFNVYIVLKASIRWFLRFFFYEPMFRARCETVGKKLRIDKFPYVTGYGKIVIGDNVYFDGKSSFHVGHKLCSSSVLKIGNNTTISHGCNIIAGLEVSIGDNVLIGGDVRIADNDGHPNDYARRRQGLPMEPEDIKPVEIRDDVWIGANSWIGKGVIIGERSIIGAHSVVRRNIPPDVIVAGNPARVAGKLG